MKLQLPLDVLINNLPLQQLIYTKQSKLKLVKLIELNNKCKTAASCKDCSIRRNSADRYAYEIISSFLTHHTQFKHHLNMG